jgi:hypothetical protein
VGAEKEAAQKAVEELVALYQAKARAVSRAGVAVGAFTGVAVGAIPLSPLRAAWPIPSTYGFATLLGGLVVGVLIGYVIGDPRAKLYQRMADQARLQLQLEQRISQNDARMAQLLTALTARAAAAARQTTPAPPPQPVYAPPPLPPVQPAQHVQPVPALPQEPEPVYAAPPPRLRTVAAAEPAQAAPPLSPPNAYDTGAR